MMRCECAQDFLDSVSSGQRFLTAFCRHVLDVSDPATCSDVRGVCAECLSAWRNHLVATVKSVGPYLDKCIRQAIDPADLLHPNRTAAEEALERLRAVSKAIPAPAGIESLVDSLRPAWAGQPPDAFDDFEDECPT